jgi:folate-binding protein YgfZ
MKPSPEFLAQHEAIVSGVAISPLAGRTIIDVTGADRTQLLQSFTTNDIKQLVPGRGCEAFVTSPQGKTLCHVLIFREADKYVLDTTPGQAATLIGHFERYVITEDVQFIDRTAELCDLLVAGPKAAAVLSAVASENPPTELLSHAPAAIAGRLVMIRRVENAGPAAWFVQASVGDTDAVVAALSAAGAIHCDAAAVESARLEAGVPLFGIDITPENLPQEVNRDARAISFTKGCYLGQETVARIDAVGHVNRLLVGMKFGGQKFGGQELPTTGLELLAGDQPVGHVTSAAWSPRLNAPLALGYVRRLHAKPGSQLSSAIGPAEVIKLPLD